MLSRVFEHIKKNGILYLYATLSVAVIFVLASLLHLSILQSDDYSYSAYLKDGFLNFLKLTREHYLTCNGRVLVHIFAQLALSLPKFVMTILNTLCIIFTAFFAFNLFSKKEEKAHLAVFLPIFISLLFTLSPKIIKETFIWTSGFYNYVFPALIVFGALNCLKFKICFTHILCFLAGATTEQWGFAFIIMLITSLYPSRPFKKDTFTLLSHFSPVFTAILGYGTIFLSPATYSRVDNYAHTTVSGSLIDLPLLSKVFIGDIHSVILISLFLLILILSAFSHPRFKVLFTGFLPLFLALLLPLHNSCTITFVVILLYTVLCGIVCFTNGDTPPSVLIFGAIASVVIMIPTNTFDARIVFPFMLLSILALSLKLTFLFEKFPRTKLCITLLLSVFGILILSPAFKGFLYNYRIDTRNLNEINLSKDTGIINYNIDYNKDYAMRQMFNDGWFFTKFIELYDLENCKINLVSSSSEDIYYKGENTHIKGIKRNGYLYVPVREFLEKTGGKIATEKNIEMILNNRTLRLEKGMFIYGDDSYPLYAIAEENRLPDFYTLYIKEDLLKKAFDY